MAFPAMRSGARTSLRNALASSSSGSSSSSSAASLACCSSSSSLRPLVSRRELHYLPPLSPALQQGAMPLISKTTTDMLWNGWQRGLLERLNAEVKGTDLETSSLVETVIASAQKPERIITFNLASQALNNAFFLSRLLPPRGISQDPASTDYQSRDPPSPSAVFTNNLAESFGSLTAFKAAFSAAALGMSGSGWVWLVQDKNGKYGIIPTFGAGTVLVQSRKQRGPSDLAAIAATSNQENGLDAVGARVAEVAAAEDRSHYSSDQERGRASAAQARSDINDHANNDPLYPLLCLSVHEHAWLPDWGIWGKEEYLARFWEVVDWNKVEAAKKVTEGSNTSYIR